MSNDKEKKAIGQSHLGLLADLKEITGFFSIRDIIVGSFSIVGLSKKSYILIFVCAILLIATSIYFILKAWEYRKIKRLLNEKFNSNQMSFEELQKSLVDSCMLLGIDKCTVYAQDKSNSDLILFFEHNTKRAYMRGLVRTQETSHQIWLNKNNWYARKPINKDESKNSSFRDRENIKSSMAFPLRNGVLFGVVFVNFTEKKLLFRKEGEMRWIERWKFFKKDKPNKAYEKLLGYFIDELSFQLELQRNLVNSPLVKIRKLTFFTTLFKIIKSENFVKLPEHILSGVDGSKKDLQCALYLRKNSEHNNIPVQYEMMCSGGMFTPLNHFVRSYTFEDKKDSFRPIEYVFFNGGGTPFVASRETFSEFSKIQFNHLFSVRKLETIMIFPIHRTSLERIDNNDGEDNKYSRIRKKNETTKPYGFIVVLAPLEMDKIIDLTPMSFNLVADYIGMILNILNLKDKEFLQEDITTNLEYYERLLQKKASTWKDKIGPLLDLVNKSTGSQQSDLWVFRTSQNKFHLAVKRSHEGKTIDDKKLEPRPDGNTLRIMKTGQNFFWPNTKESKSLKPEANSEQGINALMGFPISGVMNSYGVIWIRWEKPQTVEFLDTMACYLEILFYFSSYALSIIEPENEVESLTDDILEGKKTPRELIPISKLPKIQTYDEAVLLIKPPNSFTRLTIHEILSIVLNSGCEIHAVRVYTGSDLSKKDSTGKSRIDKHLGRALNIAEGNEAINGSELRKLYRVYNRDRKKFFENWRCYPEQMKIIPALSLLSMGLPKDKLTENWDNGRSPARFHKPVYNGLNKIGEHRSVLPVEILGVNDGNPFFLLNGYIPGYKSIYEEENHKTIALLLRWEKEKLSWKFLREEIFGDNNNPDECFSSSIRYRAKNDHSFFIESKAEVNGQKNVIHFSASALEAAKDIHVWFDVEFKDTILGYDLFNKNIDLNTAFDLNNEQFINHKKREKNLIIDSIGFFEFWNNRLSKLKAVWSIESLQDLFTSDAAYERKYILNEFFFWKNTLFDNKPDSYSGIANRVIEKFSQKAPKSVTQNITFDSANLASCLEAMNYLSDTEIWENEVTTKHFIITITISCWLADQIEINTFFKGNQGIINDLNENLKRKLPDLAKRLISYGNPLVLDAHIPVQLKRNEEYINFQKLSLNDDLKNENQIGLILAAGRGSRAKTTIAKGMLHLDEETTVIEKIIKTLRKGGLKKILVAVDEHDSAFKHYLSEVNNKLGGIIIVPMGKCKGVGFRMAIILKTLIDKGFDGKVITTYSDVPFVTSESISKIISASVDSDFTLTIASNSTLSGQVFFENEKLISSVKQSRFTPEIASDCQDAGVYGFKNIKMILDKLEEIESDLRGDYVFADVIGLLNNNVKGINVESKETLGVDKPCDLLQARLVQHREKFSSYHKADKVFFEKLGYKFFDYDRDREESLVLKELRGVMDRHQSPAAHFYFDDNLH